MDRTRLDNKRTRLDNGGLTTRDHTGRVLDVVMTVKKSLFGCPDN